MISFYRVLTSLPKQKSQEIKTADAQNYGAPADLTYKRWAQFQNRTRRKYGISEGE